MGVTRRHGLESTTVVLIGRLDPGGGIGIVGIGSAEGSADWLESGELAAGFGGVVMVVSTSVAHSCKTLLSLVNKVPTCRATEANSRARC